MLFAASAHRSATVEGADARGLTGVFPLPPALAKERSSKSTGSGLGPPQQHSYRFFRPMERNPQPSPCRTKQGRGRGSALLT